MDDGTARANLRTRIETARARSIDWLWSMQAPGRPRGVLCISAAHEPKSWPGVLLYGTYNGVLALALTGGIDRLSRSERAALVAWLESHRRSDGIFKVPGMRDADVFKKPDRDETWRYIDFHVTNYALGAIEMLASDRAPILEFARPWLDPTTLKAWLSDRDFRDPWQEGNNVVNLASFLLLLERHGSAADRDAVAQALAILFDWHDRYQEPETGFWGVGQSLDSRQRLHAFAGAMHNFHLWYARGRALAHHARAIDYVLTLPTAIDSACIDVDAVDLLVHATTRIDHRRTEIDRWLTAKLAALLDFQNDDGGFADERIGTRRQDGWVRGYEEPQGLSNTFATWFRWIAIAMIADHLWSGAWPWHFRRMIGIGYRA